MASVKDTSFIPNMPNGPLDEYRKRAKFDWKDLRLIFEDENLLRLKYKTWNKMENDPLFAKPKQTPSADEQKYRAAMQMNATNLLKLAPPDVEKMTHRQKVWFSSKKLFFFHILLSLVTLRDSRTLCHCQCFIFLFFIADKIFDEHQ